MIGVSHHGAITRITLQNGAKLNPLSSQMLQALTDAVEAFASSDARVLVIAAEGKAFCAGHDLREIQGFRADPDGGAARMTALFTQCSRLMHRIATLPKPVIAEVQGIATAAGCQLAASCDFVVAADHARFGVNGINIGLFCSTPIVALSRKIPPSAAYELAATGDFLDAARAQSLGLVTRVTVPEDLTAATMALAEKLATKLPSALAIGKRVFAAQAGLALDQAYAAATPLMVENLMNADTDEGLQAFIEKRQPRW
ncbi:enoyl-CoA hydratase [Stagnihabitans tardus]|uniref:Enoyl-CoA hydratase domain-containing protein 3, mitochondrial n=1 Tax=Stagnihabitans tardus TaxID=2699202 RepID=A0AAE4YD81_9RHOB|nr:enoyl-CoA hydratase [Stagnihabitans tardus]NBZ89522.1 enoyl-CoA hydratase [Stagnihabitans tardus]